MQCNSHKRMICCTHEIFADEAITRVTRQPLDLRSTQLTSSSIDDVKMSETLYYHKYDALVFYTMIGFVYFFDDDNQNLYIPREVYYLFGSLITLHFSFIACSVQKRYGHFVRPPSPRETRPPAFSSAPSSFRPSASLELIRIFHRYPT